MNSKKSVILMRKVNGNPFLEIARKMSMKPYDIEEIVVDKAGLTQIGPRDLDQFPNLQVLYVPNNKLARLNNLEANYRLKVIDARQNQITCVDFRHNQFIKELYLANNLLIDLDTLLPTISHLRDLEILDLRFNRVTQEKNYRQKMISTFPSLKIIDGLEVLPSERVKYKNLLRDSNIVRKARSQSVVEYLKTSPPSRADKQVLQKAMIIRKKQQEKEEYEDHLRHEEMERRKEAFEAAAAIKEAPMPADMDFLGQQLKSQTCKEIVHNPRKQTLRPFLKAPTFQDDNELTPGEETFRQLNPDIPVFKTRRIKHSIIFPN